MASRRCISRLHVLLIDIKLINTIKLLLKTFLPPFPCGEHQCWKHLATSYGNTQGCFSYGTQENKYTSQPGSPFQCFQTSAVQAGSWGQCEARGFKARPGVKPSHPARVPVRGGDMPRGEAGARRVPLGGLGAGGLLRCTALNQRIFLPLCFGSGRRGTLGDSCIYFAGCHMKGNPGCFHTRRLGASNTDILQEKNRQESFLAAVLLC